MSWIPLYGKITESSLWDEEDWVIKVFFTMMAEKGPGDIYTGSAYALGHAARKTEGQILEAWKILSGPDRKRKEHQPHDGARILKVEGGWLIINAALYRKKMSEELKRYRNAKAQKVFRERQRQVMKPSNSPTMQERVAQRYARDGEPEMAERVAGMGVGRAVAGGQTGGQSSQNPGPPRSVDPGLAAAGLEPKPDVSGVSGTAVPGMQRQKPSSVHAGIPAVPPDSGNLPGPEFLK